LPDCKQTYFLKTCSLVGAVVTHWKLGMMLITEHFIWCATLWSMNMKHNPVQEFVATNRSMTSAHTLDPGLPRTDEKQRQDRPSELTDQGSQLPYEQESKW
jgi:hypothetical protein